jgi:23S rRNA pseudouridine1911/1915/1917 synthase
VAERLSILFEDPHCLAVAKPAGQFTQGSWAPPGETTLEGDIRAYLDPDGPESVYVGIVHRLDRPTSGVLIWAKTPKAARRLSAQFERRQVVKEYWAVVARSESSCPSESPAASAGPLFPGDDEPIWSDWLTRANQSGVVTALDAATPGARAAVTRVRCEATTAMPEGLHWLRLWPETGRTHQLRVQAARRGLPIVGDAVYGSTRSFTQPHAIGLHARAVRLRHPVTGAPLVIVARLPVSWSAAGINLPETEGSHHDT